MKNYRFYLEFPDEASKRHPMQWYRLKGSEYSTDLLFFMQHQICLSKNSQDGFVAFSRLDGKTFLQQQRPPYDNDQDMIKFVERIHQRLLAGWYGEGVLVTEEE